MNDRAKGQPVHSSAGRSQQHISYVCLHTTSRAPIHLLLQSCTRSAMRLLSASIRGVGGAYLDCRRLGKMRNGRRHPSTGFAWDQLPCCSCCKTPYTLQTIDTEGVPLPVGFSCQHDSSFLAPSITNVSTHNEDLDKMTACTGPARTKASDGRWLTFGGNREEVDFAAAA